jgi:ankyrin repeat protein
MILLKKLSLSLTTFTNRPAFELGLDHVLANPLGHRNLSDSSISRFTEIFANEETYNSLDLTSLHRIILGITSVDLAQQLELSVSEINTPDAGGRTPLMWAVRRGDIKSIQILLEWGADVEKADRMMIRPIHKAVADADDECVRILLEAGAVATVADVDGAQPIHNIVFSPYNRVKSIEALLAHGADLNARCNRQCTPLHWAVDMHQTEGAMDNIQYLVDHGADIEALDSFGDSAVIDAICTMDLRMLRFLIKRGAILDRKRKNGTTALHVAVWNGTLECWDILTNAARIGRFQNLDLEALHEKHDIWHCFDKCRDKWFVGERQSLEVEKPAFQRLIEAIEGIVFEVEAEASSEDFLVEGVKKDSTVSVEHVELVMTDDESIYADAKEVL